MNGKRIAILIGLVLVLCLTAVPVALAFEGREGDVVTIGADEVIDDDLYVGAGTFTLDGTVRGDVIAGGENIIINGTIEGDLIAAGKLVEINGTVEDDARIAGQALRLGPAAMVGDDMVAMGYSLEQMAGSELEGTLYFAGMQALLAGRIAENANVGANGMEIRGSIDGNVAAELGSHEDSPPFDPMQFMPDTPQMPTVAGGLTLGEGARIGGDLEYRSSRRADIPEAQIEGDVAFEPYPVDDEPSPASAPGVVAGRATAGWVARGLRRLVALVVVGVLLAWLAPAWIKRLSGQLSGSPWASLGWGALTYILFPVAIFIALAVVIALTVVLGIITLGNLAGSVIMLGLAILLAVGVVFGLLVAYLTRVVVGYLIGHAILGTISEKAAAQPIWCVLLGTVIVGILLAIPFCIGGLIGLVITFFGLGTLWLLVSEELRGRQGAQGGDLTPASVQPSVEG